MDEHSTKWALRQWIITRPNGSEILIDLWSHDGQLEMLTMAERERHGEVWGPPFEGREV